MLMSVNNMAKTKVAVIEREIHRVARNVCPKYTLHGRCHECSIACPFDKIAGLLREINNGGMRKYAKKINKEEARHD